MATRRARIPALLALLTIAAAPAPGFDCGKASGAVERVICSDEELAKLDRALADRYEALHHTLSPEGFAVLRTGQAKWLASRGHCTEKDAPREQAAMCLSSMYTDRSNDLNTTYRTADGLSIEDREISRHLPRLRVYESDSYPLLLGPKARVEPFNRYVAERLNLAKGMFAVSGIEVGPKPEGDTTFSRYYEIHRFDEGVISIKTYRFHESFFGHGWRAEFTINWDLRRNRPLRLKDLFRTDKDWQQGIYEYAMKDLREGGDMEKPESWFTSAEVDDDDAWLFDDDGAIVLFGHGERSMVGASADVSVPYDVLRPFLRADTPL